MKVTTIKRISLDGFAKLAAEKERLYEWTQGCQDCLDKEKEALKTELLKLLKDSIDDVLLRDIMLVDVSDIDIFQDTDGYGNLTGLIISFLNSDDGGTLIAKWRIPLRRGSYLEANIDDNRRLHISYKRGA